MNIGDKYSRIEQIGAGWNQPFIYNSFQITHISEKYVHVFGIIASGIKTSRKINKQDFEIFINKYKLLKNE